MLKFVYDLLNIWKPIYLRYNKATNQTILENYITFGLFFLCLNQPCPTWVGHHLWIVSSNNIVVCICASGNAFIKDNICLEATSNEQRKKQAKMKSKSTAKTILKRESNFVFRRIEIERRNNGKRKTLDPFCHFRFRFEAGNSVMIMTRHEHDEMQSFVLSL